MNSPILNQRIDLTEELGFFVDVVGTVARGEEGTVVTWSITTIDPATGEQPLDPLIGFLPTNDDAGRGEGFVTYTVRPKRTAETGDVIDSVARIVFDVNEPIDTPPIFNTLDALAPSSAVAGLPASIEAASFLVSWSGTDDDGGSAVADYTIYVSVDAGEFTPWLTDTTLAEATYAGETGHTYGFYSVARDNAGNEEAAPETADATIVTLAQPGSIAGVKWEDMNGDGDRDLEDAALPGRTIFVDADGDGARDTGEAFATTAEDGSYVLTGLQPGLHVVREELPPNSGWIATAPANGMHSVTVGEGQEVTGVDFGNFELGRVYGMWFHDHDGDGVRDTEDLGRKDLTVYIDANDNGTFDAGERSTLSDSTGAWSFTDLRAGHYVLRPGTPLAGMVTTGAEFYAIDVTSGFFQEGLEFGEHFVPATISGYKWEDLDGDGTRDEGEPGLQGWVIYIDANANGVLDVGDTFRETDANGYYEFTQLFPGTYVIGEQQQAGWVQTYPHVVPGPLTTTGAEIELYAPGDVVELDSAAVATPSGSAGALTGLDAFRSDARFAGIDGRGVTTVVIDTGIDLDHPFFAGRVVFDYDFADADDDASDRSGHGSLVTSIIGADDATYGGLAPGADLISLKVFEDSGRGYFTYLEEGLQWVVDHADEYEVGVREPLARRRRELGRRGLAVRPGRRARGAHGAEHHRGRGGGQPLLRARQPARRGVPGGGSLGPRGRRGVER